METKRVPIHVNGQRIGYADVVQINNLDELQDALTRLGISNMDDMKREVNKALLFMSQVRFRRDELAKRRKKG